MPLELTVDDLLLLEQYRLQRFRICFNHLLESCPLGLDEDNSLSIHCMEEWAVDRLFDEIDQLRACARVVLGVRYLTIHLLQAEIYRTPTASHPF